MEELLDLCARFGKHDLVKDGIVELQVKATKDFTELVVAVEEFGGLEDAEEEEGLFLVVGHTKKEGRAILINGFTDELECDLENYGPRSEPIFQSLLASLQKQPLATWDLTEIFEQLTKLDEAMSADEEEEDRILMEEDDCGDDDPEED